MSLINVYSGKTTFTVKFENAFIILESLFPLAVKSILVFLLSLFIFLDFSQPGKVEPQIIKYCLENRLSILWDILSWVWQTFFVKIQIINILAMKPLSQSHNYVILVKKVSTDTTSVNRCCLFGPWGVTPVLNLQNSVFLASSQWAGNKTFNSGSFSKAYISEAF